MARKIAFDDTDPIGRPAARMSDTPLLSAYHFRPPRSPVLEAVGQWLRRQVRIELFSLPGYGLTLGGLTSQGFVVGPRDLRPTDAELGRSVRRGHFIMGGTRLDLEEGEDPWNRPSPSRSFAVELHRFSWLPHVVATGENGVYEALKLTLGWFSIFGDWSPFAWGPEVLSRRVFNLACACRRMSALANTEQAKAMADSLARQARHLMRLPLDPALQAEQLVAVAVAGCALGGRAGDYLRKKALRRLPLALGRTILADGGHASRSPEAGLELLFDLLTLDDALLQRGLSPPRPLLMALERLTFGVRCLTLPDGRLVSVQGGEATDADRIQAALAHEEAFEPISQELTGSGYQRLTSKADRGLVVVVDTAAPVRTGFGASACDQPLSISVTGGRDRLITNCGWSPRERDHPGYRLAAASSGLSLGEASPLTSMGGWIAKVLGPRLEGPQYRVAARRIEAEPGILLETAHDGYGARFGLAHERRLYVDHAKDELRGEDRLLPLRLDSQQVPYALPYCVRFILDPQVLVSLTRDKRSVLLRGPSGQGYWFRNDASDLSVEMAVVFENGIPRKSQQIVLRGAAKTDSPSRIRWKLSRADEGHRFGN